MTNNHTDVDVLVRLNDLKNQSERWHKRTESSFLTEEEQAIALQKFPPSDYVRYEGGYEGARKRKIIFVYDEDDYEMDIVCIEAEIDNRFRAIGHRDVYGALMHLQIDRSSFGDFWVEDDRVYIYTSNQMAKFLCDNLTRIANLMVDFKKIDYYPVQTFYTKTIEVVIASPRADAIVAALAHCSRTNAKELIRQGKVQFNHHVLEAQDELCNNGTTISIRGIGRFTYAGIKNKTRKDRVVAEFLQDIQRKEA